MKIGQHCAPLFVHWDAPIVIMVHESAARSDCRVFAGRVEGVCRSRWTNDVFRAFHGAETLDRPLRRTAALPTEADHNPCGRWPFRAIVRVEIVNQNGNPGWAVPKVSSQLSVGEQGADSDRGFSGAGRPSPLEIAARLRLFAGVERETLEQIAHDAEWFSLPSGWTLFREGEAPDGLYVVASGRLAVTTLATRPGANHCSRTFWRARPWARWRCCRAPRAPPRWLPSAIPNCFAFPRRTSTVCSAVILRSHISSASSWWNARRIPPIAIPRSKAPRSVALLPLSEGIPLTELAHGLCDALLRMGLRAQVLDTACARLDVEWHGGVGEANDVVIYQADAQANPWTRLCIRQSDHVLAVADASAPAPPVSARIGALLRTVTPARWSCSWCIAIPVRPALAGGFDRGHRRRLSHACQTGQSRRR